MIGQRLSHYRIEGKLGAGGMGEVFLASDLALGRRAAIKILPPTFSAPQRARLFKEAAASQRLQHPGIATFYEAGEDAGRAYIAMEYVEGTTLRERLRAGVLGEAGALALVSGILEALAHAHGNGILHRDIKPENIMLAPDSRTKLLDFGLASDIDQPEAGAATATMDTALTAPGMVVGTAGYMAPEQLNGGVVDVRSDLFAVGAVLYEAISGRPAHPGDSAVHRMAATLGPAPPPPPAASAPLQAVLARALARDPSQRHDSAAEFLRDVRRLGDGRPVATLPDTIAILDLLNRSGNPEDAWIGGGIADSLGADLGRFEGIGIVPRARIQAAVAAAGPGTEPLDVGLRLGCRWVISGSYQRAGDALRVVAELADVGTREVIAREKLDGRMDGVFEIQDRLAARAAEALRLEQPAAARAQPPQPSLAAYECLARGRERFFQMSKGGFVEAQEWYEEAIRQDPEYADALAALAGLHDMRFTFTTDPAELRQAVDYARRAAERDAGNPVARVWLAYGLWRLGDREAALEVAREAQRLDADDMYPPYFAACILMDLGRPDEAVPLYQRSVAVAPAYGFGWVGLGNAHMETGRYEEAVWTLERGIDLEARGFHTTAGAAGYLGECLRRSGDAAAARRRCLAGLEAVERTDHMYRDTFRAICLNALGRAALDQRDAAAAAAAFHQCLLHLDGRPRTLAGGALRCQALAGLAHARLDAALLEEAGRAFATRPPWNWSWIWLGTEQVAAHDLARAAAALGLREAAARWAPLAGPVRP